jgi:hypothetical protein
MPVRAVAADLLHGVLLRHAERDGQRPRCISSMICWASRIASCPDASVAQRASPLWRCTRHMAAGSALGPSARERCPMRPTLIRHMDGTSERIDIILTTTRFSVRSEIKTWANPPSPVDSLTHSLQYHNPHLRLHLPCTPLLPPEIRPSIPLHDLPFPLIHLLPLHLLKPTVPSHTQRTMPRRAP